MAHGEHLFGRQEGGAEVCEPVVGAEQGPGHLVRDRTVRKDRAIGHGRGLGAQGRDVRPGRVLHPEGVVGHRRPRRARHEHAGGDQRKERPAARADKPHGAHRLHDLLGEPGAGSTAWTQQGRRRQAVGADDRHRREGDGHRGNEGEVGLVAVLGADDRPDESGSAAGQEDEVEQGVAGKDPPRRGRPVVGDEGGGDHQADHEGRHDDEERVGVGQAACEADLRPVPRTAEETGDRRTEHRLQSELEAVVAGRRGA